MYAGMYTDSESSFQRAAPLPPRGTHDQHSDISLDLPRRAPADLRMSSSVLLSATPQSFDKRPHFELRTMMLNSHRPYQTTSDFHRVWSCQLSPQQCAGILKSLNSKLSFLPPIPIAHNLSNLSTDCYPTSCRTGSCRGRKTWKLNM